jgi:hypothetical protein
MWGSDLGNDWLEARTLSSARAGRLGRAFADERLDGYLRANWKTLAIAVAVTLPIIVLPLWLVDSGSGVRGLLLGMSLTALFLDVCAPVRERDSATTRRRVGGLRNHPHTCEVMISRAWARTA